MSHRYVNQSHVVVYVSNPEGQTVPVPPYNWPDHKCDAPKVVEGEHYMKFQKPYGALTVEPSPATVVFREDTPMVERAKHANTFNPATVPTTAAEAASLHEAPTEVRAHVDQKIRSDFSFLNADDETINKAVDYVVGLLRNDNPKPECPEIWLSYQVELDRLGGVETLTQNLDADQNGPNQDDYVDDNEEDEKGLDTVSSSEGVDSAKTDDEESEESDDDDSSEDDVDDDGDEEQDDNGNDEEDNEEEEKTERKESHATKHASGSRLPKSVSDAANKSGKKKGKSGKRGNHR